MNKRRFDYFGLIGLSLFFIVIFMLGMVVGNENNSFTIQDVCLSCSQVYGERDYQTMNLTKFIDTIYEKCGGGNLYKRYGDDDYSVFVSRCKEDGYCKYDSIKLSDCLYN